MTHNCRGSLSKQELNPFKLATAKVYTPSGLKDQQWGKCVIAIDKFL